MLRILRTLSITFLLTLGTVTLVTADTKRSITMRELREAYLKVNGGRQNFESLQSFRTVGRIVPEGTDESNVLSFRIIRKRLGMLRQDVTYPNGVTRKYLVNSKGVWAKLVFPNGEERSEIVEDSQIEGLQQSARMLSPFMQTDGRSDWVDLKGLESLGTPDGEIMAYRLVVLPVSGLPFSEIWLDGEHYREVLVIARNADPVTNDTVRSTFYRKYDKVGGLQFPTELLVYEDGQKKQTIQIEEIKTNIGIFKSYFNQAHFLEDIKSEESPEELPKESPKIEEMRSNAGIFKSYSKQANFFEDINPFESP